MAELVVIKRETVLDRFVRYIRMRLWLALVFARLGRGMRIGAGFLLVCGFFHRFVHPMPISAALLAALLPLAFKLFNAVREKPSIIDASCRADRLLGAKSLLITAVELFYGANPVKNDFSPLIIRQATQSVSDWRKQLELHPIRPARSFPWTALVLALPGCFLLLQPGKTDNNSPGSPEWNRQTVQPIDAAKPNPLLEAIRKQESSAVAGTETDADNMADQSPVSRRISHFHPARTDTQASAAIPGQPPAPGNTQNPARQAQGMEGVGGEADLNPASLPDPESLNMAVKSVETNLDSGDLVSNAKAGAAMFNGPLPSAGKSARQAVAASAGANLALAANLSFSQQFYAAAFFNRNHPQQ